MLLTLIDKVNGMQMQKELLDVDRSQWIDADLSDDEDCLDDPSYIIPEEVGEKSENSITTSSYMRYNLRQ